MTIFHLQNVILEQILHDLLTKYILDCLNIELVMKKELSQYFFKPAKIQFYLRFLFHYSAVGRLKDN